MSNIDNELAFGSYVSLPIRTEKTAEEKWIELREELLNKYTELRIERDQLFFKNKRKLGDQAHRKMIGLAIAIRKMDELDT